VLSILRGVQEEQQEGLKPIPNPFLRVTQALTVGANKSSPGHLQNQNEHSNSENAFQRFQLLATGHHSACATTNDMRFPSYQCDQIPVKAPVLEEGLGQIPKHHNTFRPRNHPSFFHRMQEQPLPSPI
jgi:hypothetical protein